MRPWITPLLVVLTLAMAIPAGVATAKGHKAATGFWVAVLIVLSLAVISWRLICLQETRKLQQAGLRVGQILGTVAMLGLFGLAVFIVFFISCVVSVFH